jgi:hypothetical protein
MKQTIAAMLMGLLAGVAACSGARASGQGREGTAAALAPNAGRGAVASPWLDDPDSGFHLGAAGDDAAPVSEDSESSEEESDDFGDGGGDDSGDEGGDDGGEGDSEADIDVEEGWGGDEDWDEEDPGGDE